MAAVVAAAVVALAVASCADVELASAASVEVSRRMGKKVVADSSGWGVLLLVELELAVAASS